MPDQSHSSPAKILLPNQLTDLIDCLPDAVAIVDDSGTIGYLNDHLAAMFGFERGALVGQPVEVLIPERFRRRHVEHRADYRAKPHWRANSDDLALHGKRKDGSEFPVDVALNPFSASDVKSVIVTIRDISRRKELEQCERAAKEMLAAVVESSPVAIVGLAPDRQVLVWNRVAEEIFRRNGKGATGQPLKLMSDGLEAEEEALVKRALAGETLSDIPVQYQFPDGSLRHVSFSCAPMRGRDGKIQGVALALQDITERRKGEAELIRLARTDPLTGLLNRRAFFERLEFTLAQARRSELGCAVILFDIDNFKEINDLFGHEAGDHVLVAIAKNVKKELRETDSIARIGGDEFAILAPNLRSASAAMEVAEKIVGAVKSIHAVDDTRVEPSISVGISVYPMDDNQADVLVSHADMAMYMSKTRKKGSVNFFDSRMDESVKERHALKRSMPDDIVDGRFFLLFQSIVDAETREMVGAEGLARWCRIEGKVVQPAQFIPIAEECGLIANLGNRLFEDACGHIRQWGDAGKRTVPISLNISPLQLRDPGFGVQLIAKMEKLGIDPHCINIEITETTIIKNLEMMRKNLNMMKRYGVGIHIDDFGTGYSSLSVLKDLPLDVLKIDRSFVRGIGFEAGAESIVQAVVELSKKLGFRTIAEGVETEEQVEILHRIGVNCMQGFFFSRPVEAKELAGRLGRDDSHLVA
jgi:diguanylate cyclase (GGDEF)-like protein/PAS domain S-box-containing protein